MFRPFGIQYYLQRLNFKRNLLTIVVDVDINVNFFSFLFAPIRSIGLIFQFLHRSQTVGLLGLVISSSQGFYLNTGQHKHRKTPMP
jgi:hypothetical protein